MLQYDFEESIGYWLCTATHGFQRAVNDTLAPHGITFRQAQILFCLACYGDLSQSELAGKLMVEPPTLVGILDRMERAGWITRHDCPGDRRKKIVRPTQAAEDVWDRIVDCSRRVRAAAVAGMTPRQVDVLKKLLGQVRTNLDAYSPDDSKQATPTPTESVA